MAKEWAIGAAALFACATILRTVSVNKPWRKWVPGGIAVAIGKSRLPVPDDGHSAEADHLKACTMCLRSPWRVPLAACSLGTGVSG